MVEEEINKTETKITEGKKIDETESLFLDKFNKIDLESLQRQTKEKNQARHKPSISEMNQGLSLQTPQTSKGSQGNHSTPTHSIMCMK